ncbi:MAG: ABC transporter substrate-binding protein [Dehalococcoidia bacterium]
MLRFVLVLTLLVTACASAQPAAPAVPAAPSVPVEGWPRQIEAADGPVTLERQPQRLHALSLGFEEILLALAGPERLAAVSTIAVNPSYSNSVAIASKVAHTVGRDPEAIVATEADVIIAASTSRRDLVDRLRAAGVTVIVPPFRESIDELPRTIRWLARISGDEAAGERMVAAVEERLARVDRIVATIPDSTRPRTLLVTGVGYAVAGDGALRHATILRAGGRNAAAEAGIQGDKNIGLETIVAIDPDIIVTTDDEAGSLARQLRESPALADLSAVKRGRVIALPMPRLAALSHFQVLGIEDLARVLHPTAFATPTADFPERF